MQPASSVSRSKHYLLCALLAAAILALDLYVILALDLHVPLGVAGGVPYVAVILVCLWSPRQRDTIVVAAVCSLLTLVGFGVGYCHFALAGSEAWQEFPQAFSNRVFALLAIWVTALLVERRKQDLHDHERVLRAQMDVLVELTRSQTLGQGNLRNALREITEAAARVLQTQRVGVWLFNEDGSRLRCVEQYEQSSDAHTRGTELQAEKYPSYFAAIESERTISAEDAIRDPRTSEFKETYLEPLAIASMLDAPIRLRGRMVGVVCHEHVGAPRRWTVEEQNFAVSVAVFVDLALEASDRKRAEDELREHHDRLEELVGQRTAELKRVNEQLVDQINEHKRAVEALEESEERYGALMENLPVGVYRNTPGPKGRFLLANPAQVRMLGYDSAEEFLRSSVAQHYAEPRLRQAMSDKLLTEGRVFEQEVHLQRRDGSTMWAAVTAQVVRDAAGDVTHIDGIIEDITERKEAEEQLARQAQELVRSNAELERFAYAVSHDLQEPLRAVAGHCKLLERRYRDRLDQDAGELITQAVDGAMRMKAMIDGLLAYSRVGSRGVTIAATDCEAILDTALANLKTSIDDCAAIVSRDPVPTVMANGSQLVALFQNLISNAIKYCGEKVPEVHIGAEQRNERWVFCVRDKGIGIELAHRDRIFSIFQRLHTGDQYPGAGIGLAICRKIVEGLGGRIWVESEPGKGSTFLFTLPKETSA